MQHHSTNIQPCAVLALIYRSVLLLCTAVLCCCGVSLQVLETLVRLKKKDPILKQPDVVLFPQLRGSEGDAPADAATAADGKKSKPMYLRTVLAKQVGDRQQYGMQSSSAITDNNLTIIVAAWQLALHLVQL